MDSYTITRGLDLLQEIDLHNGRPLRTAEECRRTHEEIREIVAGLKVTEAAHAEAA